MGADYEKLLWIFRRAGLAVITDKKANFIQVAGSRFSFDAEGKLLGVVPV